MLSIGNITLNTPLLLSPMAGISDLPYRLINRSLGCELAFTEMISATALAHKNANTMDKLSTNKEDRPLGVQIVGRDPELIKRALDNLPENAFDIIDFNVACPAKKVASKGKGAGLLKEPLKMQELLKLIVKNTDLPVTVKIRSGWDEESVNAVEIARRAQDAGVKGLFIHGRTKKQGYSGTVNYNIIREVKEALEIPVIASGDALTPVLIKKIFDETGCDAVAIARGALGNPWIFRETAEYLKSGVIPSRPDIYEFSQTMQDHCNLNISFKNEKVGIIRFRKFFAWYTRGMPVRKLKIRAFQAGKREEMLQLISEIQNKPVPGDISNIQEIPATYNQLSG